MGRVLSIHLSFSVPGTDPERSIYSVQCLRVYTNTPKRNMGWLDFLTVPRYTESAEQTANRVLKAQPSKFWELRLFFSVFFFSARQFPSIISFALTKGTGLRLISTFYNSLNFFCDISTTNTVIQWEKSQKDLGAAVTGHLQSQNTLIVHIGA